MILIGINDTHDASACLIKDGKIIDVVLEERLSRKKGISSLPTNSIKYILKKNKINSQDIDHVSVPEEYINSENYVLKVNGDSMIDDQIRDGDYVIVRRTRIAKNGDTVVAIINNEATLKRYYLQNNNIL